MYPDILNYDQVVKVTGSFKTPMGCRSFLGVRMKTASRSTTGVTTWA
jgi:ribonucleoside-triphosphate reductase